MQQQTTHLPCPDCGSSDALTDYGDHTFCFSCSTHSDAGDASEPSGNLLSGLRFQSIRSRGLSQATCQKFGYGIADGLQVAPYYCPTTRKLLFQKVRSAHKQFTVKKADDAPSGSLKTLLFGRHVWGDSGGLKVVITEGEVDALTSHEALGTLGIHSVSVSCGAQGALDCLKANFDWLDRYAEVYLSFDNDEQGRTAAAAVLQHFGDPRFMLMNIPETTKDLNELWLSGGREAVLQAYQTAKAWKPRGIIDPKDYYSILMEKPQRGLDWPWPTLNQTTYGIIPGLILIAAGSGVGKTTLFKQVEAHAYQQQQKIGVIHLEESAQATLNGILTLTTGQPFHTPDARVTDDQRRLAAERMTSEDRLVLFDKQVGFDEDIILGTIRYMVQGLGCSMVFLDHLTAITDQYDREVNQKTRNLIVKLGKLVTSLEFPLLAISHLRKADGKPHEEGGRVHLDDLLGSGAIKQWATHVFALERDNQAEDPELRNRPILRDLKNRPLGEFTGTCVPLVYDPTTYTLKEVTGFEATTTHRSSGTPVDF